MEIILDILTCIFEIVIFDVFFRNVTQKKYKNPLYNMLIFLAMLIIICSINSYGNSLLNLVGNIIIYFLSCCLLFETTLKKRIFYFIVFYTAFAGVEIIFEFTLSLVIGDGYQWYSQTQLSRLIVTCLEKLVTFITLFIIEKKLNKNKCGIKNGILIYSFVLPIATFGIYSTLLYSGLRIKLSELSETFLIISCILLLFANAIIFLMYDYIFQLNYEKQMFEMISLKTDMEKKYYDRMEKVNVEQSNYMHDLKFLLKTIGDLAVHDQNEEIKTVVQGMKIRIGEMEDEFYTKNKVLNTILCEKKREAIDCQIDYTAYVEPGVPLSFIQDIDLIIIMGNIIDNAIEASKKVESGYLDIKIFETQKGHFLMIRVENKFNGIVKRQGDSFHTTKENESKHGIGLKNVKDCIKKYDGILQIDTENNVFTVSIIFTVL